jgi:hypothetical protein
LIQLLKECGEGRAERTWETGCTDVPETGEDNPVSVSARVLCPEVMVAGIAETTHNLPQKRLDEVGLVLERSKGFNERLLGLLREL